MNIFIPTPLRSYAEGKGAVEVNAATIAEALDELTETYPGLRKHLFTEEGKLRAFVNLYCNDEEPRSRQAIRSRSSHRLPGARRDR
jgi:hypothetical protein